MRDFLLGFLAAGYGLVALLFARFHRRSGDAFFSWFAAAFGLLAVNQIASGVFQTPDGVPSVLLMVRLLAYLLILVAILRKNSGGRSRSSRGLSGYPAVSA